VHAVRRPPQKLNCTAIRLLCHHRLAFSVIALNSPLPSSSNSFEQRIRPNGDILEEPLLSRQSAGPACVL